mgnify:CR=1 FL=1
MKPISSLLADSLNSITVNSNNKNIDTVNNGITVAEKIENIIEENDIKPEGIAKFLSEELSDEKSYGYFLILAKENKGSVLLQVLHDTKDADSRGVIRRNKAVYFMGILRKKGIKTKFKKDEK